MVDYESDDLMNVPTEGWAREEADWRLIAAAIAWILFSFFCSFVLGFFIGFTGALLHVPHPMLSYVSSYAGGFLSPSIMMLSSAVRGRIAGSGDVNVGLANYPIQNRVVVLSLAVIAIGYAALLYFVVVGPDIDQIRGNTPGRFWLTSLDILQGVVFAPLGEEAICRGWLWTALRTRHGLLSTALLTSAVWIVAHVGHSLKHLILLIPVAIVLALARHFGRSVRAPILVHAIYNLAIVGLALLQR